MKALQRRFQDWRYFLLIEFLFSDLHNIGDASSHAVLHHDPKMVIFEVGTVVADNVIVVAFSEDTDLNIGLVTSFLMEAI